MTLDEAARTWGEFILRRNKLAELGVEEGCPDRAWATLGDAIYYVPDGFADVAELDWCCAWYAVDCGAEVPK